MKTKIIQLKLATLVFFINTLLLACSGNKQQVRDKNIEVLFPTGEKITNNNFTGTAYLQWYHPTVLSMCR